MAVDGAGDGPYPTGALAGECLSPLPAALHCLSFSAVGLEL